MNALRALLGTSVSVGAYGGAGAGGVGDNGSGALPRVDLDAPVRTSGKTVSSFCRRVTHVLSFVCTS